MARHETHHIVKVSEEMHQKFDFCVSSLTVIFCLILGTIVLWHEITFVGKKRCSEPFHYHSLTVASLHYHYLTLRWTGDCKQKMKSHFEQSTIPQRFSHLWRHQTSRIFELTFSPFGNLCLCLVVTWWWRFLPSPKNLFSFFFLSRQSCILTQNVQTNCR